VQPEPEPTTEQWQKYCTKRLELTENHLKQPEDEFFIEKEGEEWRSRNRYFGDEEMEKAVDKLWREKLEREGIEDESSLTRHTQWWRCMSRRRAAKKKRAREEEWQMSRWDLAKMPLFKQRLLKEDWWNRSITRQTEELLIKKDHERVQNCVERLLRSQETNMRLKAMMRDVRDDESKDLTRKVMNTLSCGLWGSALYPYTCKLEGECKEHKDTGGCSCLKNSIFRHNFNTSQKEFLCKTLQEELGKLGFTLCGQRPKTWFPKKDLVLSLVDWRQKRCGLNFKFDPKTGEETGELQHIRIRMLTESRTFSLVKVVTTGLAEVCKFYKRHPTQLVLHLVLLHYVSRLPEMFNMLNQARVLAQAWMGLNLANARNLIQNFQAGKLAFKPLVEKLGELAFKALTGH